MGLTCFQEFSRIISYNSNIAIAQIYTGLHHVAVAHLLIVYGFPRLPSYPHTLLPSYPLTLIPFYLHTLLLFKPFTLLLQGIRYMLKSCLSKIDGDIFLPKLNKAEIALRCFKRGSELGNPWFCLDLSLNWITGSKAGVEYLDDCCRVTSKQPEVIECFESLIKPRLLGFLGYLWPTWSVHPTY